jgi:hypothetical protein
MSFRPHTSADADQPAGSQSLIYRISRRLIAGVPTAQDNLCGAVLHGTKVARTKGSKRDQILVKYG